MGLVTSYDSRWPAFFEEERHRIATALTNRFVAIEHVGSTSVPGLAAKPVVDIAVAVDRFKHEQALIEPVELIGYAYVPEYETDDPMRRYFHRRVTDVADFRGFHLHMYEAWHEDFLDYIRFRDHLRTNADDARAYEELKLRLDSRFPDERTRYQDEKGPFIQAQLATLRAQRSRASRT